MKKIFTPIICLVIVCLAVIFIIARNTGLKKVYIKTLEGNRFQLMVKNRPYIVKGVIYNPVPIGQNHTYDFWSDPLRPYILDGKLMKDMGVNTIRVYQPGKYIKDTKHAIRDLYNIYGIRIAMGHWLGFWESPNYADPVFRERVKRDVLDMVRAYKDEKEILLWVLGNENNISFSYGPHSLNLWTTDEIEALGDPYLQRQARARIYYSFVNEIAQEIHRIDPRHLIVMANKELVDIDAAAGITPAVDILGCSVYRGKTFGNFFRETAIKFKRPVLLTEFGCDRYDAFLNKEDEDIQAEFIGLGWKEIYNNTYKGNRVGNSLGGFVFEWTDEWWKLNEDNKPAWSAHDTDGSWSNSSYYFDIKAPQNLNINEEWWGVCALKKNSSGLDERIPTKAYFKLKELWK